MIQRVKNEAMETRLNELKSLILTSGSVGGDANRHDVVSLRLQRAIHKC